ncbi:hypothetical protein PpBr36_08810 [Pyricularia pennisetigena]|uniref:hypothetical protein n=1 Tax=Pyricularia pennisetigena TaxID=1578925 RepID=UPI001153438E|nr:hypothetical protein PpBr36_08810 [Pyricularia pennisetigena]TLS24571.1 hypothetical protein PpBr36_08810 [Pyricularia pennisetigena]
MSVVPMPIRSVMVVRSFHSSMRSPGTSTALHPRQRTVEPAEILTASQGTEEPATPPGAVVPRSAAGAE